MRASDLLDKDFAGFVDCSFGGSNNMEKINRLHSQLLKVIGVNL